MIFWRLFTVDQGVQSPLVSATWQFAVLGTHSAPHMSSWWNFTDLEGDGYADLLYLQAATVFELGGSSTGLGASSAMLPIPQGNAMTTGDVNGDGFMDVVVPCAQTNTGPICVLFGSPSGLPTTVSQQVSFASVPGGISNAIIPGDVDGDGYADLVFWEYSGTSVTVATMRGSASGLDSTTITSFQHAQADFWAMGGADFNGDGYADVIGGIEDVSNGAAYLYLGGPGGFSSTPTQTILPPLGVQYFGRYITPVGDVNGDGYPDVVIEAFDPNSGTQQHFLYFGNASGIATSPAVTLPECGGSGYPSPVLAQAGDLNGDGYSDFLLTCGRNGPTSPAHIFVYLGAAGGPGSAPNVMIPTPTGDISPYDYWGGISAGLGDVNNDGFTDFAGFAYQTANFDVFFGAATTPVTPTQTLATPSGPLNYWY
jgi:hypothetical protein